MRDGKECVYAREAACFRFEYAIRLYGALWGDAKMIMRVDVTSATSILRMMRLWYAMRRFTRALIPAI